MCVLVWPWCKWEFLDLIVLDNYVLIISGVSKEPLGDNYVGDIPSDHSVIKICVIGLRLIVAIVGNQM